MPAILLPTGKQAFVTPAGVPAVGYKVATFAAGTVNPQTTWADALKVGANANPIILDARGEAAIFWDGAYKVQLQDPTGTPIWTIDNITTTPAPSSSLIPTVDNTFFLGSATFSWANLYLGANHTPALDVTSGIIGYIPRTAAEIAAAVTPTSYVYAPGFVERYGTNTVPGTTDMGPALQSAINQMLKSGGAPVRFGSGAYSIATLPTFGGASTLMTQIDIGGNGQQTQIIHNGTAGSGALFDLSTRNGWYLHDFWMMGNSAHKNDGIYIGNAAATEAIRWRLERVNLFMCGYGVKMQNTNTGEMRSCKFWPNNPPAFIVPQTVVNADVLTHIYMTGAGFNHNITFYDVDALPDSQYGAGVNRGIKMDCNSSYGVNIIGGVYETNSGANNEIGIEIAPTGACGNLTIVGPFIEGAAISLKNVINSHIGPITNGTVGSTLTLLSAVRNCVFDGVLVATINNADVSNYGNTWIGCTASTTWTMNENLANNSNQPNRYIGCVDANGPIADRGSNWRKLLAYSANITSDTRNANTFVIRVTNGTAFTVNAPATPYNGQIVRYRIRNESGGVLGAVTWSAINGPTWTAPLNGFSRVREIQYDTDFAAWYVTYDSGADIPN